MARSRPPARFEEGRQLRILRELLEDPEPILTMIGALGVAESHKAFREQAMGDVKWKTRDETGMNPNVPAVIRDLTTSSTIKPRRFQGSPVMIDSGRGRRSVAWEILDANTVQWGTNLGYMNDLHAGNETESDPITATVQSRLWKLMGRARKFEARTSKEGVSKTESNQGFAAAKKGDPAYQGYTREMNEIITFYSSNGKASGVTGDKRRRLKSLRKFRNARASELKKKTKVTVSQLGDDNQARYDKALRMMTALDGLAWMLNKKFTDTTITITHPPRPIVGMPDTLIEDIESTVGIIVTRGRAA